MCVLGGALMHITLGSLYCWGNFLSYAPSKLRFFDGVDRPGIPDASLIMPATLVAQCLSMPFGPILVNKFGSKIAMMIGALVVGSGIFLSSYATTLASFMSLYAVVFGAGIGLAYTAPMIAGWKWLPTKKGLVSGKNASLPFLFIYSYGYFYHKHTNRTIFLCSFYLYTLIAFSFFHDDPYYTIMISMLYRCYSNRIWSRWLFFQLNWYLLSQPRWGKSRARWEVPTIRI